MGFRSSYCLFFNTHHHLIKPLTSPLRNVAAFKLMGAYSKIKLNFIVNSFVTPSMVPFKLNFSGDEHLVYRLLEE